MPESKNQKENPVRVLGFAAGNRALDPLAEFTKTFGS